MKSMTGFGRAAKRDRGVDIEAEARSVNHRFLTVKVSLPEPLARHETELEQLIRKRLSRGSVNLNVSVKSAVERGPSLPSAGQLKSLHRSLDSTRKSLKLKGEISLGMLLSIPGVWASAGRADDRLDKTWPAVRKLAEKAIDELTAMRDREGGAIAKDILARLDAIDTLVGRIRQRAPDVIRNYQKKLDERVATLLSQKGLEMSKQDLAKEIALYADRCDISEELQRLSAHVENFRRIVRGAGSIGRRLDFLTQEMVRETNTLAAKGGDSELSGHAVEIKAELEKIKEQAENVE